jgi:hypothetical protein
VLLQAASSETSVLRSAAVFIEVTFNSASKRGVIPAIVPINLIASSLAAKLFVFVQI